MLGIQHVEHVVRNRETFGERWFGGADIETPIQLERIAIDDFPAESLGYSQGEGALSCPGWADNGKDRPFREWVWGHA